MRTFLIIILVLVLCLGAGYYTLPFFIQSETKVLKTEIETLKGRIIQLEAFVRNEQDVKKVLKLQPDAEFKRIIDTVNTLSARVEKIEETGKKDIASVDESLQKYQAAVDTSIENQAKALNDIREDVTKKEQINSLRIVIMNARAHLLKARVELASKNIGTVKSELDIVDGIYKKAAMLAKDEKKDIIAGLRDTLKKARMEIDTDLPSAASRIELLWHETEKLSENL